MIVVDERDSVARFVPANVYHQANILLKGLEALDVGIERGLRAHDAWLVQKEREKADAVFEFQRFVQEHDIGEWAALELQNRMRRR